MIDLRLIATPLIGGLIGLVTNGIAIRMLFRPLNPVKIGNLVLPFTPGLIPKEKPRIAKAIGKVIGNELLDTETLQKALASDSLRAAFDKKVDSIIETMGHEEGTMAELLQSKGYLETIDRASEYIGVHASEYIAACVVEQNISARILEFALKEVFDNLNPMAVMMAEPAIRKAMPAIGMKIDETILQEGPAILKQYIDSEYHTWIDKPVKDVGIWLWQKKDSIKDKIWEMYLKLLEEKAGQFIRRLDVSAIVEEKINEYDSLYLEQLILEISRKELNSLVWIGGVLGLLIGIANVFLYI